MLLGIGLCTGYRKLRESGAGPGTDTVTIGAPVPRVFASLAHADSISGWMADRRGVSAGHHGMLVTGDTLHVETRVPLSSGMRKLKWTVSDVRHNQLLALEMKGDVGEVVATRQLILAAKGESTFVTSAIAAPIVSSMRAGRSDTLQASDAYLDAASKLLISALRLQSHIELEQLKARVEGRPPSR